MKLSALLLFAFFSFKVFSQDIQIVDGIPNDIKDEKLILLKFDSIQPFSDAKKKSQSKYILKRQNNHNRVIKEANRELVVAAMQYPHRYAISRYNAYKPLKKAGYKYVLSSNVYSNDHLVGQPEEDVLIKFEYFIIDLENNLAYKVFELDEMKVYDSKLLVKKLKKAIKG